MKTQKKKFSETVLEKSMTRGEKRSRAIRNLEQLLQNALRGDRESGEGGRKVLPLMKGNTVRLLQEDIFHFYFYLQSLEDVGRA